MAEKERKRPTAAGAGAVLGLVGGMIAGRRIGAISGAMPAAAKMAIKGIKPGTERFKKIITKLMLKKDPPFKKAIGVGRFAGGVAGGALGASAGARIFGGKKMEKKSSHESIKEAVLGVAARILAGGAKKALGILKAPTAKAVAAPGQTKLRTAGRMLKRDIGSAYKVLSPAERSAIGGAAGGFAVGRVLPRNEK